MKGEAFLFPYQLSLGIVKDDSLLLTAAFPYNGIYNVLVINHQFNWWFDISPPKGYVTARPKGRYRKHFTGPL